VVQNCDIEECGQMVVDVFTRNGHEIYGRLKCICFSCPIYFHVHLLSNLWDHEKHMLVKDHGTKWKNYMSYIFKVFKGRNLFSYKQVIVIIIIKKKLVSK